MNSVLSCLQLQTSARLLIQVDRGLPFAVTGLKRAFWAMWIAAPGLVEGGTEIWLWTSRLPRSTTPTKFLMISFRSSRGMVFSDDTGFFDCSCEFGSKNREGLLCVGYLPSCP